jgi:hypothetical protein
MTTALLPAPAPCTEPACLHATPGLPCRCTDCHGAGHGHIPAQRGTAGYVRRVATVGGNPFALLPTTDDEEW